MSSKLVLSGLDGSNPLGFLAALGTFCALTVAWPNQRVQLSWAVHNGAWSPTVHFETPCDQAAAIQVLFSTLEQNVTNHPIAFMESMHGSTPAAVRSLFREHASTADATTSAALDWLSAMCSDVCTEATSQIQTVRRDYFWGNLKSVMKLTTPEHLRRSLFEPWDYADALDNQSLHFEPTEDRRHAHQWYKPSGDPTRKNQGGMLGANRLAIEAFPLFQSIPSGDKLSTRGFTGVRRDDTRWTWPIWSCPIDMTIVVSLLALSELQSERPDRLALAARGVATAFRCRRILVEKTPNFTPTLSVC